MRLQGRAVLLQLPFLPLCPSPPAQAITPGGLSAAFGLVSTTSATAHPTICFPSRFDAFQGTLLPPGGSGPGIIQLLGGVRSTDPFEGAGSPLLGVLWVQGNSLEQPE